MHRNVEPSELAQGTFQNLSPAGKHEIREICAMMEDFWEVLLSAKYLRPRTFWGIEGYVYRDEHHPYVLVTQLDDRSQDMHVLLIEPAPFPPRQMRI